MNNPLNLKKVLKLSYDDNINNQQSIKKNGYNFDSKLSNKNEKVYYNPNKNKLLVSVAGTHNFIDVLTGHSLGGSIVSYAGSKNDTIYTLDKGATIGTKTRSNEKAYRNKGDVVSLLSSNSKHMKTFGKTDYLRNGLIKGSLKAHDVKNIQSLKIFI